MAQAEGFSAFFGMTTMNLYTVVPMPVPQSLGNDIFGVVFLDEMVCPCGSTGQLIFDPQDVSTTSFVGQLSHVPCRRGFPRNGSQMCLA